MGHEALTVTGNKWTGFLPAVRCMRNAGLCRTSLGASETSAIIGTPGSDKLAASQRFPQLHRPSPQSTTQNATLSCVRGENQSTYRIAAVRHQPAQTGADGQMRFKPGAADCPAFAACTDIGLAFPAKALKRTERCCGRS